MTDDWAIRFADAFDAQMPGLVDGDASEFDILLRRISLAGGSVVDVPRVGVTVLVGPNNSGKSTLLRETVTALGQQPGYPAAPRIILDEVLLEKRGEARDVIAWVGDHSTLVANAQQLVFQTSRGLNMYPVNINAAWQQQGPSLGELAHAVVHYSHAQDRFSYGGAVEMRDSIADPAIHPLHKLQDSRALLDLLNTITKSVFGEQFTLDVLGRSIQLRVGKIDLDAPPIDNISIEYRDAMKRLPTLEQQGDGIRGFMGQLLPLVASSFKIVALDEPEAFLHPPQAYGLGEQLGRLAVSGGIQAIVATHDRNLLAGLLDSGVDVSVVRLARTDTGTSAHQLDAAQVADLWHDPVLRFTNVLDGLFHRAVVLAEAEADCGYYGAALDVGAAPSRSKRDLLLIPTGGKEGMPRVASALAAVGVPTVATADLDLLNDHSKIQSLVAALGGVWTAELSQLWLRATNDLRAQREGARIGDVKAAVLGVLGTEDACPYTPELHDDVKAQLRTNGSRWQPMKAYGVNAFIGQARVALEDLLRQLDGLGIVLVREGELERLAPEVAVRKGPRWLPAALLAEAHANAHTQAHVERIRAAADR